MEPVKALIHSLQPCLAVSRQQVLQKAGSPLHGCWRGQRRQLGQQQRDAGRALLGHDLQSVAPAASVEAAYTLMTCTLCGRQAWLAATSRSAMPAYHAVPGELDDRQAGMLCHALTMHHALCFSVMC